MNQANEEGVREGPDCGFFDQLLRRKVLALALVGILLYGSLIVLDNLVIRPNFSDVIGDPGDLDVYQERAQNILDGQIPYRDFYSESPPLIMYLFVVPQALGGEMWQYQAFFTLFAIMTALTLFLGLRRFDENLAFRSGLSYLLFPLTWMEFVFGVQDEAITMFFFVLALILFVIGLRLWSGIATLAGAMVKVVSLIPFPWMLLKAGRRDGWRMLGITLALTLLACLPFLICCPEEFLDFPRYYLLGQGDAATGGSSISPWHFLALAGFGLPGWLAVSLTVSSILISTYLAYRWKWSFWQGTTFIMVVFFLFYPKVLLVYFLIPVVLLLMWAKDDKRVLPLLLLMIVPLFASVVLTGNGLDPIIDEPLSWIAGLVLGLIGWSLLLLAWRLTWGKMVFFERELPSD